MARYDFKAQRLYVEADLAAGAEIAASPLQANYLKNVLRLGPGAPILLFNGREGEWRAEIGNVGKRSLALHVRVRTRAQEDGPDLHYLFAPLKRARLDYMVEKATEMGVALLKPVLTRFTTPERVNLERLRSHTIEAAEQCGLLRLPAIDAPERLLDTLDRWDARRRLVFADESAPVADPILALRALPHGPIALLTGPEGGFADEERARLNALPFVTAISLGPRILRADTAAVAALALINAVLGDWCAAATSTSAPQ